MKILHLSKFYPPDHFGGVETVCRDLCEGFALSNYHNTVLCHTFSKKKFTKNLNGVIIKFCPISFSIGSFHFSFHYLIEYINSYKKFDLVHIHCPNPLAFISLFILPLSQKYILHWHSDIIRQKILYIFFKYIENQIVKNADLVIGATVAHIISSNQYKLFKNKFKVIPYVINFSYLNNYPQLSSTLESYISGKKFIFTLGRHVSYKGMNVLIESIPKVNSDIGIVIGGIGPCYQDNVNLVKKLNLESRVIFTGKLSLNEIIYLYRNCLFFCLPSLTKAEMFGVVQLEAMYFGKPVVSCDIEGSGVSHVNLDGLTGLTTTPNCSDSLAKTINYMIENKNFDVFKKNIKKHFKLFDYQNCLNHYIKAFKILVQS